MDGSLQHATAGYWGAAYVAATNKSGCISAHAIYYFRIIDVTYNDGSTIRPSIRLLRGEQLLVLYFVVALGW